MATKVTSDLYVKLDGKLAEIKRQIRQPEGYPFDPEKLNKFLQRAVEGRFNDIRRWQEKDGVIYFSVVSDGTTGPQWIERLKKNNFFRVTDYAKSVLNSLDFKPTNGVTYQIAVLRGTLFVDDERFTSNIIVEAVSRNLEKPNAEVACLIREMFSDEDLRIMDLSWMVVFHEPINDSVGSPSVLAVDRRDNGLWLGTCHGILKGYWGSGGGFAFVLPQISSD